MQEKIKNDTIYRQAAIDAVNSHFGFSIEEEYGSAVQEVLNGLPSAQPEIIHCRDCANYQTDWIPYTMPGGHYCPVVDTMMREDEFCSRAERREA